MKFLASDFDGTLFISKDVKKEDIDSIKKFRKEGNIFSICTGRPVNAVLEDLRKFKIPFDYIIGVNGAIMVSDKLEIISSSNMDLVTSTMIQDILIKHQVEDYVVSNGITQEKVIGNNRHDGYKDVRGYYITTTDPNSALLLASKINIELLDNGITAYPNNHYVAVGIKGVHKGYGIKKLVEQINFKGDIYVVGDDYNDIPMFKRFNSYGISSGVSDAISFASKKVDSVSEAIKDIMNK